jgi:hypothetical protein
MKLTDKRFWIFETLALLSTATTLGIMGVCLGRFEQDGETVPIICIILSSYLVGQTVVWKVSKCLKWLKLGLSTYFYSIISFASLFAFIIILDYLDPKPLPVDGSADTHIGFSTFSISLVALVLWSLVSFIPSMLTGLIASIYLDSEKTKSERILKSVSLETIGVHGFAYSQDEALKITNGYFNSNKPILGGDVYKLFSGRIESTSDSWYCNRKESETLYDYIVRSYHITCDYIRNYPDKTNTFFSIVIEQIEDEIRQQDI